MNAPAKLDQSAVFIAQAMQQTHVMRDRLEGVRSRLQEQISGFKAEMDKLSQAVRIEYTGYLALLKRTEKGWECVAIVDSRNLPDDLPEEWDVTLAIPEPGTLPEWEGW